MKSFNTQNFISIMLLSVTIYYAFVWAGGSLSFSKTYATILEMHLSPLYYLTIGLCVGLCFTVDLFIRGVQFSILTSPSDLLREDVSLNRGVNTSS